MFGKKEFKDIYENRDFIADCRNRIVDPFKFQIECVIAFYRCLKTIINELDDYLDENQLNLIEVHAAILELIIEHVHINSEDYRSIDFCSMLELLKERADGIRKKEFQLQVYPDVKKSLESLARGHPVELDRHYALWAIMSNISYYTAAGPLKDGIPLMLYSYYYLIGHSITFLERYWNEEAFKDKLIKSLEFGQESRTASYELFVPGLVSCFKILLKPRITTKDKSPDFDIVRPIESGIIECRMKSEATSNPVKWIIESIALKSHQVANSSHPCVLFLECGNPDIKLSNQDIDEIQETMNKSNVHDVMVTSTNTLKLNSAGAELPIKIIPILIKDFFSDAVIKNKENF